MLISEEVGEMRLIYCSGGLGGAFSFFELGKNQPLGKPVSSFQEE